MLLEKLFLSTDPPVPQVKVPSFQKLLDDLEMSSSNGEGGKDLSRLWSEGEGIRRAFEFGVSASRTSVEGRD